MGEEMKALGRQIADAQDEQLPAIVERARERFVAPKRAPSRWWLLAAAAVIACVMLIVVRSRPSPVLTFQVAAHPGVVGEWVQADDGDVALSFSDGATVLLQHRGQARVAEVTADGAHVAVARGKVAISVPHQPSTKWSVDVGPFAVLVTGTRFDASWDPGTEVFEIDLHDGSVRVSGPTLSSERTIIAGQHLRIALAIQESVVNDILDAGVDQSTVIAPLPPPTIPTMLAPPPANSWRTLSSEGRYADALAAIGPRFDSICQGGTSDEVIALGDTARFAGEPLRAKRAYEAVRSRFPKTRDASLAAFSLGRMASQANADPEAATWFETYLHEQPNDPLAREALGRLIETRDRQGEAIAAKTLAQEYLTKYPDGPHAKFARKLTGQ